MDGVSSESVSSESVSSESVTQLAASMQKVLSEDAEQLGRSTGFIQRQRKLSGSVFAQTLVLGWLAKPDASLSDLCQTAATLGVDISVQSLEERFSETSSQFFEQLLACTVAEVIQTEPVAIPLLQRFEAVFLQDSSSISLPDALRDLWPGCGGTRGKNAALKLQVRLDMLRGTLQGPVLQAGREADTRSRLEEEALPAGSLLLTDLGYFSLKRLANLDADDVCWLTRVKSQCDVIDADSKQWKLADFLRAQSDEMVDLTLLLGAGQRLPCRLLAVRVPKEVEQQRRRKLREYGRKKGTTPTQKTLYLAGWTILATNVSQDRLSLQEALVLMRLRWQIELLFKLWKLHGHLDKSRSCKPWRVLTEVYAKLIAMVIQHWVLLTSCWAYPDRSLVKAAATLRQQTIVLVMAFAVGTTQRIVEALRVINVSLMRVGRINKRRNRPSCFQLLIETTLQHNERH